MRHIERLTGTGPVVALKLIRLLTATDNLPVLIRVTNILTPTVVVCTRMY